MKLNTKSFGFRLWSYFVLFTALIFTVLWLLQTVFLQSFYNEMIIRNTRSVVEKIIENSENEKINDLIDELAHDNSVLIFITDTEGNVRYTSDEFSGMHKRNISDNGNGSRKKNDRKMGGYRELPDSYDSLLNNLNSSDNGTAEYRTDDFYICGAYINYCYSEEKSVLYVGATIEAVGASVSVISMQLVWVTGLSLIVGFVLSWFIARRFSTPIDILSEKAKQLGEKEYQSGFRKGFCTELDELSDTLDKTNIKLNESRDFQMELLSNVSHDLRTPLTMIKGYAEMIRDISWEDEKQCSEDLAVIIKEADRLTALVNEIMEYSELKSEGKVGDLIEVDLSQLVQKIVSSFETLYKPEGIIVEKVIDDNIHIIGSKSRLERALFNLMDNAVRHTGENKKIRVELHSDKDKAIVSVTDYGEEIPESEQEHIWDRYYTSRMRKGKGVSGLGLAIVRQVTNLHGGSCKVKSEKGKGSTFYIELPHT